MSWIAKTEIAFFFMAAPLTAFGHPGHEHIHESALWHFLSDPLQVFQVLLAVSALLALTAWRRRARGGESLSL